MARGKDQQTPETARGDGWAYGLIRATQSIQSQYQADVLSQAQIEGEASKY